MIRLNVVPVAPPARDVATSHGLDHFVNSGVGLAWPLDKYESLTVNISRVSETREWGREPRATRATSPTAQESLPQVASAEQSQRRKLWGIPIRGLLARLSGKLKRPKREGKDVDFSWTTQDKDVGRFYNGDKEREGGTDVDKEDPWKVRLPCCLVCSAAEDLCHGRDVQTIAGPAYWS